jgi:hypothetical protein
MAGSYSRDLRGRVLAAVEAGESVGAAAERFVVGRWFRQVSRQQVPPALSNAQAARSGRLQDGKDGRGPAKEEQSAAGGGDVLVAAGTGAQEVAQLVVASTEPGGRSASFEAPHGVTRQNGHRFTLRPSQTWGRSCCHAK